MRDKHHWLRAGEHVDFKLCLLQSSSCRSTLLKCVCQSSPTSALIHRWELDRYRNKHTVWSKSIVSRCCQVVEQSTNEHGHFMLLRLAKLTTLFLLSFKDINFRSVH